MLAATLAVGSVPAIALVQASTGAEGASVALAAESGAVETADGYWMVPGETHSLPVSFLNADGSGAASMASGYMEKNAEVSCDAQGNYSVTITTTNSDMLTAIAASGASVSKNGASFAISGLSSIGGTITLQMTIAPMAAMGMPPVSAVMQIDASSLPTEAPEPPAATVDKTALNDAIAKAQAIVQGDKTDEAWAALQQAIAKAQAAAANEDIPQADIDGVLGMLNAAIETFNASEGEGSGTEAPEAQTVAVSYFVKDSGKAFSDMLPAELSATPSADGGYDVSIPVAASTVEMVNGTFWVKDASGADAPYVKGEDGSRTYTLHVDDIAGAFEFSIGYTAPMGPGVAMTHNMIARCFDCSAINAALDAAKAIEDDGSDAYAQLQEAVEAAKLMVMSPDATQKDLETAAAQINDAIETYNNGGATETPEAVETPGGFLLVPGQAYEVPASVIMDDGSASMAAKFFNPTATVTWTGDAYQVDFSVTSEGAGYITSIEGIESLGDGAYRATVDSLTDPIALAFALDTPMGAMNRTAYLSLDTADLPTVSGEPVEPETPEVVTPTNPNPPATSEGGQQESTARFQAGHTYQVPLDFLKHNSSEVSMADQYFGDTALVRVSDDGTMLNVSFAATADGMTHIISLAYQGATLSPSGTQFTVSIPYTESNIVLPISMTIKEMQELGGPAQTADLHLYLTQAKDLGTNAGSLSASSSRTMADTGDDVSPIAAIAGGVAVVAAAAAASVAGSQMRRRLTHKE